MHGANDADVDDDVEAEHVFDVVDDADVEHAVDDVHVGGDDVENAVDVDGDVAVEHDFSVEDDLGVVVVDDEGVHIGNDEVLKRLQDAWCVTSQRPRFMAREPHRGRVYRRPTRVYRRKRNCVYKRKQKRVYRRTTDDPNPNGQRPKGGSTAI